MGDAGSKAGCNRAHPRQRTMPSCRDAVKDPHPAAAEWGSEVIAGSAAKALIRWGWSRDKWTRAPSWS